MTARQLIVAGCMPSRDANGRALPSRLRFYLPTTSTPATVYADASLAVPLAWPIISDSAGRWPQIWAEEQTYFDVVWSDLANDAQIAAFSSIRPLSDAMQASVEEATAAADAAQAAADQAAATLVEIGETIADLGDISEAVAAAEAAAVTATAAEASASASAAAAAASAASIDTTRILVLARAYGIAAASLN